MRCSAAIGVDDDLAAGQAGVAIGAADQEGARRVDVPFGGAADQALGEQWQDVWLQGLQHPFGRGLHPVHLRLVLVGDDDLLDMYRPVVLIAQGDLALGVRLEKRQFAGVT